MSREGAAGSGRRDGATTTTSVAAQPFPPQFYPVVGYQGTPHTWFPPHPSTGVPGQWNPSWRPPMGYPTPTPPWSAHQTPSTTTVATAPSDEYTVDTLRRIYKDDDGRVEIQRVKVQRRQPETGAVSLTGPEAMSVVPVGTIPMNERRPPPRKHRRKQEIHMAAMGPAGPYPWYPYMPYMPYPYPYPYYLAGCMWPPGAPSDHVSTWSGNEESEAVSSHQDSVLNSQRLESRASRDTLLTSALHRSSSPAAASHITDIHSIAPSDSVSVRGHKRETSLERALRGPTPPPRTKSRASSSLGCKSDNAGKSQEWMLEMQRALRTSRGDVAVRISDKAALRSDHTDVYKKIPPIRKRRKIKVENMSDKSSMTDLKDADDDVSERQSVVTDATFDESSRLSSELNYAFRKLERSVDAFKTEIAADPSPLQSHTASPSVEISHSSGDATPTEAHVTPLPLSDICGLVEEAEEEETKGPEKYQRPRATSESISSLPSPEAARVRSAPDVSSSYLTTSAETNTVTVTPNSLCPSPRAAVVSTTSTAQITSTEKGSKEITEISSKTEAALEVPVQVSASVETAQTSNTNAIHTPMTPPIPPSKSSPLKSPQGHLPPRPPRPPVSTRKETQSGITKEPAEHDISPAVEPVDILLNKSTNDAVTVTCTATAQGGSEASGRHSQASSVTTFFSARTADDSQAPDTDSTDIPLATTDSATADENEESPGSPAPEYDQLWVLQRPEEAPTLNTTGQDERRNAWRAEVSLWRARLVVSLCRGRGLDRQDWATLHLMVHHPLTMDLKLSLLHAPRLCAANSSMGPALLRVALIQLAEHGQVLLQPESSRQPGWRCVRLDAGQTWTTVKGAAEILHSLGYQEHRNGLELRYRRRCSPEASVVARLTLDMLVLAEEFRLFLTGTHQYPNNVSSLFFSESLATSAIPDLSQRPPSSEGSFVSAKSEAVPVARPQSETSSVTDEDTETLQTRVTETNNHSKLTRNRSTSEEDVTLREDDSKIAAVDTVSAEIEKLEAETTLRPTSDSNATTLSEGHQLPAPDSASISSDITSLPDLQTMNSSTATPDSQRPSMPEVSSGNETITPSATPTVTPEVDSSSKADEANNVTTPTATSDATNDNPEEHVYEEIDVIRAQVQSLRASSVPTESAPPPLPPKKKISSGGEDESGQSLTYPHMEWSSASTPASLHGGSTGARRKKRRAPMPPEFLPQNWKENQETPRKEDLEAAAKTQESKRPDAVKKAEYRRSLNPFYEEIDYLEDNVKEAENTKDAAHEDIPDNKEVNGNPFLGKKVKATGHIGKNPFYDDVEILKKSEESDEIKTNQPSPTATIGELPPSMGAISEEHGDAPVVRPKRRAPRPPPTPEAQDARTTRRPEESTSQQQGEDKLAVANVFQAAEGSDGTNQANKQASRKSFDQSINESTLSARSNSLKDISETKMGAELTTKPALNKDISTDTVEKNSSVPLLSGDDNQDRPTEAARRTTYKQSPTTRAAPFHPKAPPPPPPTLASSPSTENTARDLKKDSPPPIPPPKAPLSLLDEIPYMDANEVKDIRAQRQSPQPHLHVPKSGTPAATLKFNHTAPRQHSLTLAHINDTDVPPPSPPPPPPCPPPESPPETPHNSPPESPPETPHTSPPDTPHVSPPETPHTSPPETPHASPPATPRLSPKHSPLSPRHKLQDSPITKGEGSVHERADITGEAEGEPPPIPPKSTQLDTLAAEASTPTQPPSLSLPPKGSQQEETPRPPHSQEASSAVHIPVTGICSAQCSTSEERYEIPDTSRAPPPRPPVPSPSKTQQQQVNGKTSVPPAEYDRYEVPEAPKHDVTLVSKESVETVKVPEAEERYEIPEVVKDQPLKRGLNGAPCTVALGRTSSPRRGEIAAIFGPPKPPRRRRNNHSPPPRPPKHPNLLDGTTRPDGVSEAPPRPPSTTSSLTSSSSGPPPASLQHKSTPKRRSWPFLLCDCLYVNCRTYEDADK